MASDEDGSAPLPLTFDRFRRQNSQRAVLRGFVVGHGRMDHAIQAREHLEGRLVFLGAEHEGVEAGIREPPSRFGCGTYPDSGVEVGYVHHDVEC